MLNWRLVPALLASLMLGALLSGCPEESEDGGTDTIQQLFFPNRSDKIAIAVSDSWHGPEYMSINPGIGNVVGAAAFPCCDGAGILLFVEVNTNGDQAFYLAYYGPGSKDPVNTPVRIQGDFASGANIDDFALVWTNRGDAVFWFVNQQESDPSSTTDAVSERVYFGNFHRSQANREVGSGGETWGFNANVTAIDTNTLVTDDNEVDDLFFATNLFDGTVDFPLDIDNAVATGAKGDNSGTLNPFIFIGWIYHDNLDDARAEGRFINLNDASLASGTNVQIPVPTSPAFDSTSDEGFSDVWSSGEDLLFKWRDFNNTNGDAQDHLYLVRVNASRNGFDATTVDIKRGETNGNDVDIATDSVELIGDGYRPINGLAGTWVVYRESGMDDGATQNADQDLIIARVTSTGTLEIGEFDGNAINATNPNGAFNSDIVISRGAGYVGVFMEHQDADPAVANIDNTLLGFVGFVTDDSETFANCISAFTRVSSASRDNTDGGNDAEILGWEIETSDPFCGPDTRNDVFCLVFAQEINNDTQGGGTLVYMQMVMSYTAGSAPTVVGNESVIETDNDNDWTGTSSDFDFRPLMVDSGSGGHCLVVYAANGNNEGDNSVVGSFSEPRLYAFAGGFQNSTGSFTSADDVGSDSPSGPAGAFKILSGEAALLATPLNAASRDFDWDLDEVRPEWAHLLFGEFLGNPSDSPQALRGRTIDLRSSSAFATAPQNRFVPALTQDPFLISSGGYNDNIFVSGISPNGNDLLFLFAEQENGSFFIENVDLYVNTYSASARAWSKPAIVNNEAFGSVPGVTSEPLVVHGRDSRCCPNAIGSWLFWTTPIALSDISLEGRRFFSTNLPEND